MSEPIRLALLGAGIFVKDAYIPLLRRALACILSHVPQPTADPRMHTQQPPHIAGQLLEVRNSHALSAQVIVGERDTGFHLEPFGERCRWAACSREGLRA